MDIYFRPDDISLGVLQRPMVEGEADYLASTTAATVISTTPTTTGTTAVMRYVGEGSSGSDPQDMDQRGYMRVLAQICQEGWDRIVAGQNHDDDDDEEEWTGLQVAMTSVMVMMGVKAMDIGMHALYRRLVALERTLDHEQKGRFIFIIIVEFRHEY